MVDVDCLFSIKNIDCPGNMIWCPGRPFSEWSPVMGKHLLAWDFQFSRDPLSPLCGTSYVLRHRDIIHAICTTRQNRVVDGPKKKMQIKIYAKLKGHFSFPVVLLVVVLLIPSNLHRCVCHTTLQSLSCS